MKVERTVKKMVVVANGRRMIRIEARKKNAFGLKVEKAEAKASTQHLKEMWWKQSRLVWWYQLGWLGSPPGDR